MNTLLLGLSSNPVMQVRLAGDDDGEVLLAMVVLVICGCFLASAAAALMAAIMAALRALVPVVAGLALVGLALFLLGGTIDTPDPVQPPLPPVVPTLVDAGGARFG